jgi:hypothetical protein
MIAALVVIAPAPHAKPHVLFHFADPRIVEASGIAPGIASPAVDYVENDGGDSNRFFAVDARTGDTAAAITVPGARNVDWEDIAVARDAAGTPSVWLADIGDNDAARSEIQVYRVTEPHVRAADRDRTIRADAVDVWRLRYPDGPVDAESLAVAPDGSGFVVTKSVGGSTVYRLPPHPDSARVQVLRRVGSIAFAPTGTHNPFGVAGQVSATSAAISVDGSIFVVRTYSDAYVWPLGGAGLAAALARRPVVVPLPDQPQGEGIAVSGRTLLIDSEGLHSAVYAVPLPEPPAQPHATASEPAAGHTTHDADRRWPLAIGAAAAVALVVAVLGVRRRRTR